MTVENDRTALCPGDTAVSASLADVSEGRRLAVSMARMRTMMGVAMLVGPVVGGRLAAHSLRLSIGLGGAFGALVSTSCTSTRSLTRSLTAHSLAFSLTARVVCAQRPSQNFLQILLFFRETLRPEDRRLGRGDSVILIENDSVNSNIRM